MKVLGISGRYREAAAAVAVDGRVVAAASEDSFTRVPGIGYTQTGGFPAAAVDACLKSAGLDAGDLDELSVVEAEGESRAESTSAPQALGRVPVRSVDAIRADAIQALASSAEATSVLVCGTEPDSIASFTKRHEQLQPLGPVAGGDGLFSSARAIASALGLDTSNPCQALDRLSIGGEPEFEAEFEPLVRWARGNGIQVDGEGLMHILASVGSRQSGSLSDASSLNVRVQSARRALAATFTCRLAHVVRDVAQDVAHDSDLTKVAFGGAMFANPRLSTELRRIAGEVVTMAPVPELAGRALGAALSTAAAPRDGLRGLALGPSFLDPEIKRTLDNCRLDYVYEPDWARLFVRVSKMLAQGKVVGWFQGAMGFGPRAMGTRSILCDPSNRYARQNINEYLRQLPLDEPLPIAFAPSSIEVCLGRPVTPPRVFDALVGTEWRERLSSALDWRGHVRVHAIGHGQAQELCDLLECHLARTGVPALIETNLSGPGEPVACTPRDAVRTVYSSAIDALILGRFVLMKDYWLLRNNAD